MEQYIIVPLSQCRLLLFAGHNRLEQSALTNPGEKPDGIGWYPLPQVKLDEHGNERGYLWTRKLAREGEHLIPVAYEPVEEDTQPIAVNIVA